MREFMVRHRRSSPVPVSDAARDVSSLTGSLPVRARVPVGAAPDQGRFGDPLLDDLARGGPLSRERIATRWSDGAALTALAGAKRAPLPKALAAELAEDHRRLGASAASPRALR